MYKARDKPSGMSVFLCPEGGITMYKARDKPKQPRAAEN